MLTTKAESGPTGRQEEGLWPWRCSRKRYQVSLTSIAAVVSLDVRRSYSLIGTAKLNGIDSEAWLRYVLAHIGDPPVNRVDQFLPWHFRRHSNPA